MAVNLKVPAGVEAVRKPVQRSQVYIDGNRPGFFDGSPDHPEGDVPAIGQQSRQLLSELGYQETEITRLFADKVVVGG